MRVKQSQVVDTVGRGFDRLGTGGGEERQYQLYYTKTKSELTVANQVPEVAAAYIRDFGCKQVQGNKISKALDEAHAQVCEEPAVQIEVGQGSE